jgi:tRNA nucleotidyltransferase/poly(A) polymerase
VKRYLEFINESPDNIKYYRQDGFPIQLNYKSSDAFAFGYFNNHMIVSPEGWSHPKMLEYIIGDYVSDGVEKYFKYSGRLWLNNKVISFWNYPENKSKLFSILNDIEIKLKKQNNKKINIINDKSWRIEVVKIDDVIKTDLSYDWDFENKYNTELINIHDYKTSLDFSEKEKQMHLLNQKEKQKLKVPYGFGSKHPNIKNQNFLNRMLHNEKNIITFAEFLNDKNFKIMNENIKVKQDMHIPKDILSINKIFKNNGFDLYIVGGSIRDLIIGKTPHDYDLVTNANPTQIENVLKDFKTDLQGKHFGVIRVFTSDFPEGIEIATFRTDISFGRDTKGDDKKVNIDNISIEEDSNRRDLTMNALYYDIENKEIIDFHGGIDDIKNNNIKTVGLAEKRFNEDRLRILRTIRFAARSNSKIDKDTSKAILNDNRLRGISSKDDVSQERIVEEFFKMVDYANNASDVEMIQNYLILLSNFNLFEQMFPGLKVNKLNTFNRKFDTTNKYVILSNLFQNNEINDIKSHMIKSKFPLDVVNKVCFLIKLKNDISNDNNAFQLLNLKNRYNVDEDTIVEFGGTNDIDVNLIKKFMKYSKIGITTDGNELEKEGFFGKELGIEKEKREIQIYKNL